jgi:putative ABC transport system permease protein
VNWAETIRTGLDAVKAHRLRSVLTMLGIIIGVSSVVLTVGLGQGAQDEVKAQINSLGSNLLVVSPGSATSAAGVRGGFGSASTLTLSDADAIADPEVVPDVARVAPVVSSSASLVNGTENWTSTLVGTTANWADVRSRDVEQGRFFTQAEADRAADVVVLGPDTASELFSGQAVGQIVKINGTSLTVIGVLGASGGATTGSNEDDAAVVPLGTAQAITGSTGTSVSAIYVEGASDETLGAAYAEINALLLNLHDVTAAEADFSITSQAALIDTANSTNRTLTVLLAGVAAISLLVGGIGVMNIMLVSVTERIKEIGLRKALGATPASIRRQFLVEASMLGLAGGVIGVVISVVGTFVLPPLIDQPVSLSAPAILIALITSLALGVGFGVYPASRAARLTPIQALRSQ